jgi:gliding motility-associated-like protein
MAPKEVFGNDTLRWCWDRSQALQPLAGFRSYRWLSDVEITNQNQTVQNFSLLQPRWVYCRAYDDTCFHVDSVYLLPEITTTVSLGPDLFFCQQINRTLVPTGGVTYEWSDGSTGSTYNLSAGGSGFVWVIARDANGCRSLPDTLYYYEDPISAAISISPSDTAFAPQAVYFTNQFSANIDSVYWFFGDGNSSTSFNPVHSYTDTGTFYGYMLAFSTRSGCRDSIPFRMVVDTVVMDFPNAFLPETEGVNALFRSFTRNLRTLDFRVYDRWGQKIFETTNLDVLWDGTQGGKAVMPGTYVYTADGIGKNGADYFRKGLIHVVR